MTRLFLVTSPLHLLVAILIASKSRNDRNLTILTGKNEERCVLFKKHLESWDTSPFSSVIHLVNGRNPAHFNQYLKHEKIDEIITGNDLTPEFHALLSCTSLNKATTVSYMDDGLYSYIEYEKEVPNKALYLLKNFFREATKGYKKPFPHTLGSSPLTSKCYLFYPEKRKPTLQKKSCELIISDTEQIKTLKSFAKHQLKHYKLQSLKEGYRLIAIPHQKALTDAFKQSLIKEITDSSGLIAIKNHPSNNSEILGTLIPPETEYIVIPQEVPLELLISLYTPKQLISGVSSTALTVKALSPETNIKAISWPKEIESIFFDLSEYKSDSIERNFN
ncbi:MAG: hypothetical protein MK185_16240 [Saccharospirillaceae bacterium]|nr:hypothetical protein A3759_13645 [Thalassolituus sp. HI0120]MCH2042182.1 hypothetical protein [Saccharospirillaceae bacterium]